VLSKKGKAAGLVGTSGLLKKHACACGLDKRICGGGREETKITSLKSGAIRAYSSPTKEECESSKGPSRFATPEKDGGLKNSKNTKGKKYFGWQGSPNKSRKKNLLFGYEDA